MTDSAIDPPPDDWRAWTLSDLLDVHGLAGLREQAFPTDGWSGARFSMIERPASSGHGPERFVIKRTSTVIDWIAAETRDVSLREASLAARVQGRAPVIPYLGAAADHDLAAILMPDLSAELLAWERPNDDVVADPDVVQKVAEGLARLHSSSWAEDLDAQLVGVGRTSFGWCPLPERLTLTSRRACARHVGRGIPAGVASAEKLLAGWDAFDRTAPGAARDLVTELGEDPTPLVLALQRLPSAGLHGDVKLANVALGSDGGFRLIDWQMTIRAPVAVELGWFVVANSAALPDRPAVFFERYRRAAALVEAARTSPGGSESADASLDWDAQNDLAWIVGLLLRGWRKGLDAEAGVALGSGEAGANDLAEWCERAVEAARRRL